MKKSCERISQLIGQPKYSVHEVIMAEGSRQSWNVVWTVISKIVRGNFKLDFR